MAESERRYTQEQAERIGITTAARAVAAYEDAQRRKAEGQRAVFSGPVGQVVGQAVIPVLELDVAEGAAEHFETQAERDDWMTNWCRMSNGGELGEIGISYVESAAENRRKAARRIALANQPLQDVDPTLRLTVRSEGPVRSVR